MFGTGSFIFVSTNITFLKEVYMKDFKPKSKIIRNELFGNTSIVPKQVTIEIPHLNFENQPEPIMEQQPPVLRHSGY